MNKNQLKKEFKKKCREEKTKSYKYTMLGNIILVASIIINLLSIYLGNAEIITLTFRIILVVIGVILLGIGATVSIIGESEFSRNFKKYLEEHQNN